MYLHRTGVVSIDLSECNFPPALQNILSTSERALRSGDAGTIADLVLSHHKSLELMANYYQQLEASGREMERSKIALTKHIHAKLKEVTQLQKRVADSNNQLVMLHEHVKLAKKRFEILEQVCTAPDILGSVLSEVERRRYYNSSLEKVRTIKAAFYSVACILTPLLILLSSHENCIFV